MNNKETEKLNPEELDQVAGGGSVADKVLAVLDLSLYDANLAVDSVLSAALGNPLGAIGNAFVRSLYSEKSDEIVDNFKNAFDL